MKMLVVCKRSFRPYNNCRNPRYTQKPILSTIYKTFHIKIPVQHPFSQRDATSNAFPNETQNELMFTTRLSIQYLAEVQKCKQTQAVRSPLLLITRRKRHHATPQMEKKSTITLRIVNYVETNYSATGR